VRCDAAYILGRSEAERARLATQGDFFQPMTTAMLVEAGLEPGMHVLDAGCGTGDLTRIAASIVGPNGSVVGADIDDAALDEARRRARQDGTRNVTYLTTDVRDLELDGDFDAVVGRFVLMYLADPVEALSRVTPLLRAGGIVAFQEWTAGDAFLSSPHCPEWHRVTDLLVEGFRQSGIRMTMGLGLHAAFLGAGLPAPRLRAERPTGGGGDYAGFGYLVDVLRSILPALEQVGLARADDLGLEDLADRLRQEAEVRRAAVALPSLVSAWTRRP
jgi:SAM-dependent methyltransferase